MSAVPRQVQAWIDGSLRQSIAEGQEDERLWAEMDRFASRDAWVASVLEDRAERERDERERGDL